MDARKTRWIKKAVYLLATDKHMLLRLINKRVFSAVRVSNSRRRSSAFFCFSHNHHHNNTRSIHVYPACEHPAIIDANGSVYTYQDLHHDVTRIAHMLRVKNKSISHSKVSLLLSPGYSFTVILLALWQCQASVAPLCISHPPSELSYSVTTAASTMIITDAAQFGDVVAETINIIGKDNHNHDVTVVHSSDLFSPHSHGNSGIDASSAIPNDAQMTSMDELDRDAVTIFTSGSTAKPKGCIHTLGSLRAQVDSMVNAWQWSDKDTILHVLPLHHVHGLVNKLLTPLAVGACVDFSLAGGAFGALAVWQRLMPQHVRQQQPKGDDDEHMPPVTVVMLVPTQYARLLVVYDSLSKEQQEQCRAGLASLRLMVSGSAALPVPVFQRWAALGQPLLERYGMTEIGMALTNVLEPHSERRPGTVGRPFPGVEIRIKSENGHDVLFDSSSRDSFEEAVAVAANNRNLTTTTTAAEEEHEKEGIMGALWVRGPSVFKEYFNQPEATRAAFDEDAFFDTGDIVSFALHTGVVSIEGRLSVDILNARGYKMSALQIESAIKELEDVVEDCLVVGVVDGVTEEEHVCAVVQLHSKLREALLHDSAVTASSNEMLQQLQPASTHDELVARNIAVLKDRLRDTLAPYKIPSRWVFACRVFPRNAVGKINKKDIKAALSALFSSS